MAWLELNFSGLRSLEETRHDLLTIANGPGRRNRAWVSVDPDDGVAADYSGPVTASLSNDGRFTVFVGPVAAFDVDPGSFRGAWLSTLDGADYYTLYIDLGWGCVGLGDAYNC